MNQGEVTAAAPHGSVAIAPVNHLDGLDGFLAPFGCGGWLNNLVRIRQTVPQALWALAHDRLHAEPQLEGHVNHVHVAGGNFRDVLEEGRDNGKQALDDEGVVLFPTYLVL